MERRTFLTATAATVLVTGHGDAAQVDPVRILVDRWLAIMDHLNNYSGDIPNDDPIWEINTQLEAQIGETRALTLDGLSAQLEFAANERVEFDSKYGNGKKLYQNMQRTIQQLAQSK
jgi:hypothetical protein